MKTLLVYQKGAQVTWSPDGNGSTPVRLKLSPGVRAERFGDYVVFVGDTGGSAFTLDAALRLGWCSLEPNEHLPPPEEDG